ncbi:carbohydrate sulfotransferase 4 [Haematobia irritans]|uniref:carbohydrate sulfotransferase 4 n=1 Tax=Haematobia irritans TaxID=7368 RepID=UPI003F504980
MSAYEETESATTSLLTGVELDGSAAIHKKVSLPARRSQRQALSAGLVTKRKKMSRRANVIGICGVTCLCILLLIATTQHRPIPASLVSSSSGSVGAMDSSGGNAGQSNVYAPSGNVIGPSFTSTATIAEVVVQERSKIAMEMENFEYPAGRFGVDAEKLSDLTPETEGTPVRSMVLTTWRSGSTFLGDILNSMPGNYYHYEPLLHLGIKQVREPAEEEEAIKHLKSLYYCDYHNDMDEYLNYGKKNVHLFQHNKRLWTLCKEYPQYCWRPKFLTPICKLFPLQSMKTVRLRLSSAEKLLEDKSLNIHIILLVRDPRGTMQSRRHRTWCYDNADCDDPKILCQDLEDDYNSAVDLLKKYPTRFRTLRYEDLSLDPYDMSQELLQFYGLPFDPLVEEFLDTHTKVNIGGVSSTFRDSKSAPFHWKQDLSTEDIIHIQKSCTKAMDLWGYRKIENFTDYARSFDPIIMPPPFT